MADETNSLEMKSVERAVASEKNRFRFIKMIVEIGSATVGSSSATDEWQSVSLHIRARIAATSKTHLVFLERNMWTRTMATLTSWKCTGPSRRNDWGMESDFSGCFGPTQATLLLILAAWWRLTFYSYFGALIDFFDSYCSVRCIFERMNASLYYFHRSMIALLSYDDISSDI